MPKAFFVSRRPHGVDRRALGVALIFSASGIGVAAYLLSLHAAIAGNPKQGLCTFTDTISCDKVLASPYADIAGVPLALIGLVGFAALFGLAAACFFVPRWGPCRMPTLLVLVAGLGLCFELGMTGVEVFVIQALCPYCLAALALIAGTFLAALWVWRYARLESTRPEADNA
jgi:uncharacterized membrane protein